MHRFLNKLVPNSIWGQFFFLKYHSLYMCCSCVQALFNSLITICMGFIYSFLNFFCSDFSGVIEHLNLCVCFALICLLVSKFGRCPAFISSNTFSVPTTPCSSLSAAQVTELLDVLPLSPASRLNISFSFRYSAVINYYWSILSFPWHWHFTGSPSRGLF